MLRSREWSDAYLSIHPFHLLLFIITLWVSNLFLSHPLFIVYLSNYSYTSLVSQGCKVPLLNSYLPFIVTTV